MEKTKIEKRFEGKVAIVTASTQGISLSITELLGFEGTSVIVSSRKQKNVDEAVEKLKAKGIVCYVSNAQQRKKLIDKTVQKLVWHISVLSGYPPRGAETGYG
ncbi:hypothetical protein Q3G72_023898 [Acer saccharum]|nr:hypothetical protein Q3G72_023898 [Acer saccharum]